MNKKQKIILTILAVAALACFIRANELLTAIGFVVWIGNYLLLLWLHVPNE